MLYPLSTRTNSHPTALAWMRRCRTLAAGAVLTKIETPLPPGNLVHVGFALQTGTTSGECAVKRAGNCP